MKKVWIGVATLGLLVGGIMTGCQSGATSPYLKDNTGRHKTVWNAEANRYEPVQKAEAAEAKPPAESK